MAMLRKKLSAIAFYNIIAGHYNGQLTDSDKHIRTVISTKFKKLVKGINILDFGGGTGLDFYWLAKNYTVFFLEPSINMRNNAQNNSDANDNIIFLENNNDFNKWNDNNLPFTEKMDGVLMNFAVLNCIKEI